MTRVPWYTDPVANLTISIDDDVLKRARVRAAETGTTVNAHLREELERFVGGGATAAVASLLARDRAIDRSGDPYVWDRQEVHRERLDKIVGSQ